MPETKHPLKVFLCHASADKPKVRELYRYLRRRGIKPWFDELDLVGGQDWQVEIPKALANSDAIIICLTKNSVDKEGYIQKEIRFALDKALEMPEGRIFLIPVRFEECEVPFLLSRYQWVDLFDEVGYTRMMRALKFRAAQLQRSTVVLPKKDFEEEKPALENTAREKQEHEETEKAEREREEEAAREKLEREAVERARKEEAERKAAEKAMREKAKREVSEKARRERAERRAAQIAVLKEAFSRSFSSFRMAIPKAKPFLRIGSIFGIILVSVWLGSWAMPQIISLVPTTTATIASATPEVIETNTPLLTRTAIPSITNAPTATPTETKSALPTSTPVVYDLHADPSDYIDAYGVPMRLVSADEFTMGINGFFPDEQPAHAVFLDAYYIDKYEVTNALYTICVDAGECDPPGSTRSYTRLNYFGNTEFDNYPVIYVNWDQAKTYCEWRDGRLPTEAQWQKAARGTDDRLNPREAYGNCERANVVYSGWYCVADTTAVGSYESGKSRYGIYDMVGNVWEWVADWYSDTYYQNSPSSNPTGPDSGKYKVTVGGSWHYYADIRYPFHPTETSNSIGFRCAKNANP